ncbi:hypothetical protein I3760_08G033600 [Carya illinoinensis]|nr:hypothetical protein I3760_08G033600 [Carya illinoinensis]
MPLPLKTGCRDREREKGATSSDPGHLKSRNGVEMKERQRWQPVEDALRAYIKQYGPKEWNLVSVRMGQPLHRDPKFCLERWKNYLKPGLKKGSLTTEKQSLVVSLQAKYDNKCKKIVAEVPGRTPKRLGKWWEVFKEKQLKQQQQNQKKKNGSNAPEYADCTDANIPVMESPEKAAHCTNQTANCTGNDKTPLDHDHDESKTRLSDWATFDRLVASQLNGQQEAAKQLASDIFNYNNII